MPPAKAAFFDIEGTLVRTNVVHAYAYYAANRGSALGIAARVLGTIVSIPAFAGLDLIDRKAFQTFHGRYYAGLSEDRLLALADDYFEDALKSAIYPQAYDLIDEARRAGCRIVMVSGALDFTVQPLARHLGADHLIANRLQFVGGFASGKLIPPIIEGANKANALRNFCVRENVALEQSYGYSDSVSDYAMLSVVGRPTAVNPDLRLRALARAYHWPVLDLS